ncbi:MAG: hypothetical protein RLZZ127_2364 [Planctomycetota bacterium]|jgi:glycosyltransferase involved in cell wall biosynthesis
MAAEATNDPLIDIVLRTKDRPRLLGRALDSILGQRLGSWRICLVNDGGDPAPVEAEIDRRPGLRERCAIVHHATAQGHSRAWMAGYAAGSAPLVAWHDDDDRWLPGFLEETAPRLGPAGPPGALAVVAFVEEVVEEERGGAYHERSRRLWWTQPYASVPLWRLLRSNIVPPIGMLLRRSAVAEAGGVDPSLAVFEDWDLLIRIALRGEIAVVPKVLAEYRIRPRSAGADGNTISDGGRMEYWGAVVRNRYFRKDLAAGVAGPGLLMQLMDAQVEQREAIIERSSLVRMLRRKLLGR